MTHGLILAAGMGSRLGHDIPKALIDWGEGAIIDLQLKRLGQAGIKDVWIVVGFKADAVREHVGQPADGPRVHWAENERYMDTQTGKSMLCGLQSMSPGPVVTMNGDVVFDDGIIQALLAERGRTGLAVDPRVCGEEEMKYRVRDGRLLAISKDVHGDGEAVGINFFSEVDRELLERALAYNDDGQYFERAIDQMAPFTTRPIEAVTIGDLRAMEIDFPEDLATARKLFGQP